ncbi:hypothetical protein HY256_01475, partial [Candidatus Sumerlaeota bacterium]|nr:hypothetical protein [Candidatus Sumerlaeota bacterium]
VTSEAEMKFLELKTRICMLHDGFMQSLKHDHKVGQQVLGILGQCILLRRLPNLNNAEVQKLELDWNEAYMLMNETIAGLEEERQKLANVNERAYKMKKAQQAAAARIHNILMNGWFRLIFFFLVIPGFVIVGIPMLGIYDYRNLKRDLPWTAPVYDRLVVMLRTHWNTDLAYNDMKELPSVGVKSQEHENDANTKYITPDFMISQMINLGFSTQNLEDARVLVNGRKGFNCEKRKMKNNKRPLIAYYVLFNSTEEAKRFCEMRKSSLAGYPPATQTKINTMVNVCRKANFVAIFVSEEQDLRENYAKAKWGFTDDQMKQ